MGARPESTVAGRPTETGLRVAALVLDVTDLAREAAFWTALLRLPGTRRPAEGGWADLGRLGEAGPVLSLQRVAAPKRGKNRLHLDLLVDDFDRAARRARELGAAPAGPVHALEAGVPWQVFRDPEGNEFCLCSA